ncbi:UvrD-helicase domain-containing protein [Limosilactobacillus equigenerosi]|uniref:UvrD-helicase domain-containing protein n=1 Tax=Limosilactobacillus equigenerosi TaxID=417373 RepID=UPI0009EAF187|nr:UvrD-helicase domain-containing protein [Limosilactobacillus equigenerosi]
MKLDKFSEVVCGSEFKEFNKWINDTLFKGYNNDSLIIKEYKDEFIQNKKWLIKLYRQFKNQYQSIKDRYNLYDFGDLERIVYDLLNSDEHPKVKTELQQQYQQIIVDEYQDTNRLQDTIVTTIAGNQGKLFLVGDVKQSIYGFRNADHTVFVEKEQDYLKDNDAEVFHLTVNYRTRPTTIKAINGLFSHIMATDKVNYQGQELTAGISIENRDLPAFEFNQVNHEKGADVTSVEATVVVERVVKLLNEGQVEPKDIAIISRSWSGREEYIKRLKQVGVPYKVTKSNGFLGKYEVMVALAYLKSLYDSTDKISLVAILHAPMYGLTERELAFLKVTVNKSFSLMSPDLIDENQAPKFKITDEELSILRNKLTKFNRDYQFLSKLADVLSASELLQHIFEYTDLLISMTAMPQGEERRANLYGLLDYLLDIEATMETSAQETMATLEATGELDEINQNVDENAVTYTTIHGSKGLEWPVVFVVNTGKKYANESKNNAVVFFS